MQDHIDQLLMTEGELFTRWEMSNRIAATVRHEVPVPLRFQDSMFVDILWHDLHNSWSVMATPPREFTQLEMQL